MLFSNDLIDVATLEFAVGALAFMVAIFVVFRYITPLGRYLLGVVLSALLWVWAVEGNRIDWGRLALATIAALLTARDWYREIRPRPDIHRNAIFGWGRRGAERSAIERERDERTG